MKCTHCGNDIADNCTVCPNCGAGVSAAQAPVYTAPATPKNTEMTADQLPEKFKPMGAWSYFGHSLLFSIPVVGFILLLVFALGGTKNINKRNYARSFFCGYILVAIIAIIYIILMALGAVSYATFG